MSSDFAIVARGVGKDYVIRHRGEHLTTAAEVVMERIRHPFARNPRETFTALQDVDLEIRQGEIVGIMGHNGAGKSTLLKILSRVTIPTRGRIDVYGRVGSLLEVGTGFHPELTGRENVYLNGTIIGMRRKTIDKHFDEIVDFAGVEQFLDTPVKRYSSGMYVRLAFAVAAYLDTEILLVDEVLAVGDAAFQRKSLGKMGEVARAGRTVVVVSHNAATIASLTNRAILLAGGRLVTSDTTESVIETYTALARTEDDEDWATAARPEDWHDQRLMFLGGRAELAEAEIRRVNFVIRVQAKADVESPRIGFTIHKATGDAVGTGFSNPLPDAVPGATYTYGLGVRNLDLGPGNYYVTLGIGVGDSATGYDHYDVVTGVLPFTIERQRYGDVTETWHHAWGGARITVDAVPLS